MSVQVGFGYGVLSDTLEEQANAQGYTLGDKAELFQKCKDSINLLRFHVLTDKQTDQITQRLHNKVVKSLKPLEVKP